MRGALEAPLPIVVGHEGAGTRQRRDFPWLARAYLKGRLKLDELIARHLPLGRINEGFAEMAQGTYLRAVVVLDA